MYSEYFVKWHRCFNYNFLKIECTIGEVITRDLNKCDQVVIKGEKSCDFIES